MSDIATPGGAPTPVIPGPVPIAPAIDVWSFGVTLSCVVSMEPRAWRSASDHRQSLIVSREAIAAVEELKSRFGLGVVRLLQRCLSRSPSSRPSFEDIAKELEAVVGVEVHVTVEEGVEETEE